MATKEFPIDVILSLTTGRLLCKFDQMHELIEFIAQRPVWTHELGDRNTVNHLQNLALQQYPVLAQAETFSAPASASSNELEMRSYIGDYVQRARKQFGPFLAIQGGDGSS